MSSTNKFTTGPAGPAQNYAKPKTGQVQPLVLVLVFLLLAVAGGAFWYSRTARSGDGTEAEIRVSDTTRKALRRLHAPVEIRFYSLLGQEDTPEALRAFAGRVDRLLSAYAREGGDKISVASYNSRSTEDMDAAAADGIRAFNLDKGEPCYLGLCVAQEEYKESIARLSPEWEEALEADVTRAILRVSGAQAIADETASATQAEADLVQEVKRAVPNLDALPLDQGRQVLRERALKELTTAATEMQAQLQQARQRLSEAKSTGSESGQEAAMQELREAQAAQTKKLQEISARLDAQITALERLKGVPPAKR